MRSEAVLVMEILSPLDRILCALFYGWRRVVKSCDVRASGDFDLLLKGLTPPGALLRPMSLGLLLTEEEG